LRRDSGGIPRDGLTFRIAAGAVPEEIQMGMCFCQTGRYKQHFACFVCRKMFKKPAFAALPADVKAAGYANYRPACPQCAAPMHNRGQDFAPPSIRSIKAWREVEKSHFDRSFRSIGACH
jgi:hypothetical protein